MNTLLRKLLKNLLNTSKTQLFSRILGNKTLLTEKEKIRKSEEEKNELRFKELQMQLNAQKKLTEEISQEVTDK